MHIAYAGAGLLKARKLQQQLPAARLQQLHGVKAWVPPVSLVALASTARASRPQLSNDSTSKLTCTGTVLTIWHQPPMLGPRPNGPAFDAVMRPCNDP
jgi:hypothetical protein